MLIIIGIIEFALLTGLYVCMTLILWKIAFLDEKRWLRVIGWIVSILFTSLIAFGTFEDLINKSDIWIIVSDIISLGFSLFFFFKFKSRKSGQVLP